MSGSEPSSAISTTVVDIEMAVPSDQEHDRLLATNDEPSEDWEFVEQHKPKHSIFLSHSGAQKNFVEQLCEDLERAKQSPFFDKRPDSLPKGEKFAQLIFQAARQCKLAIVVVSEEYFTRSKWPMLELEALVQARRCTILPLFLGLSCREFGDAKRRQLWIRRWEEWAQEDPRICVDVWKEALNELDRRNGLEYVQELGEVAFRKDVVATACSILRVKSSQDPEVLTRSVQIFISSVKVQPLLQQGLVAMLSSRLLGLPSMGVDFSQICMFYTNLSRFFYIVYVSIF